MKTTLLSVSRFSVLLSLAACGLFLSACGLFLSACGGGARTQPTTAPPSASVGDAPLPGFPTSLVTGPGVGPALYLGPEEEAPAIGYVSSGIPVLVKSAPVGDRVRVLLNGPIKARGWLRMARLAAYVTRGGRVRGAPASVHPCDMVGIRGLDDDGHQLHVVVTPWIGSTQLTSLGPYEGVIPVSSVSGERPSDAECAAPPGEAARLPAGQQVDVYDHPSGTVIAHLPPTDPPLAVSVARRNGDWAGVRVGTGPYLVGYVNVPLTPADASALAAAPPSAEPTTPAGQPPARISAESARPLLRLHAGTRVLFNGEAIGILTTDAFARELNRYANGEVDVYVAANDDLALRGMVHAIDVEVIAPTGTDVAPVPATTNGGPTPPAPLGAPPAPGGTAGPPATLVPGTVPPPTPPGDSY